MSHADFVHLHVHTEYSLLDGACRLDRLMERAHDLKFSSLACTDHGVLYGAIEFYKAALEKGIKPIIGCEVYVAPGSRLEKKANAGGGGGGRDVYHHLGLLAKDEQGYKNLIKLATLAHTEGYYYKPRIDKELLAQCGGGLIAMSGCLASEIPDLIMKDQLDKARNAIDWFKQTLGAENFYLELQNHGIPEQAKVNRYLIPWAKEFGLKLVATNDVHYVEKSHSHAHDCLVCIGTQSMLSDPKRMSAGYAKEQFYLRSAEEMKARFTEVPDAVTNTLEVAEKCNLEIEFGKLHYPVFHPPADKTREGYLRELVADGLDRRYTLKTHVEGKEFVVEGIKEPQRLPTYVVGQASSLSSGANEVVGDSDASSVTTSQRTGGTPVPLTPFTPFDKSQPAAITSRHLPHWQQAGVTYFVTFRLADSLPKEVYQKWHHERCAALSKAETDPNSDLAAQIAEEFAEKLERHLDEGRGECWLRKPEVSAVVENALRHFDGDRYLLGSYVIMPNHVHVLVRPAMEHKLSEILHSWKSFTAKEANKILGRSGEFWQDESFDHIIRNEQQLDRITRYIHENPIKAKLAENQYRLGAGVVGQASSLSSGANEVVGGSDASSVATSQRTGGTPVPLHQDPAAAAAIKAVLDRLDIEMGVIEKTGFISYFLIVADFIRHGREKGISCVARGSAAGSLVTYLLDIANVDPIRYGLLFERFLNPERVNPPDIDIDFADDRRADVIEYVRNKYGKESVAQIITFGTMGAKSVIRDVGRVMGLSYGDCDRLAKFVPAELKMTLGKALKQSPELKEAYDTEEVTRELIDTALILEDMTRNSSVHAAGVVIGPEPLINLLPLKQDEDGTIVTQYAMGPVGDLGLLKMDFLGLKTLTVIRNTCDMVWRGRGIEIPIDTLPLDDKKTYDLLNRAETLGVFQLESSGMRELCRKFQINSVEHITALVALYRPGPMDLISEFIKRRHGEVKVEYEHPLLEAISKETYGILIYQEQVMQAAQVLGGYTLGGADLLRRAMGKKNVEEMQQHRGQFVKGCKEKKIPEAKANQIFDLLEKFAGYGFNKSHAAAYAIVAYQTAYLKANYTVEFLSAMMTNDMGDTAKLSLYIAEARTMGIEVLPPDVNESEMFFGPSASVVARASRPCVPDSVHTGETPVPLSAVALLFTPFDKNRPASTHTRGLPHWQQEGATYFVTFRLADSLPKEAHSRWRDERDAALRDVTQRADLSEQERLEQAEQIGEEYHEKLERQLDEGIGECWLRNAEVSGIVENALKHFDGERYSLGSYVVMPNHAHVLVRPAMEHKLPDILQAWKSFTAEEANKVLGRSGEFWQAESFDRIVRNEEQLEKFGRYIGENPGKARLPEGQYRLGGGSAVARASRPCDQSNEHTGETPVPLPKQAIRFGLVAVKGIGEMVVECLLKARVAGGPFKSLAELCERVDGRTVNRKALEALIKSGACDCFGETRATLFASIDMTLTRASGIISDRQRGQGSMFDMLEDAGSKPEQKLIKLEEWPQHELLAHEKELLGFYVTGHPLSPLAPILEKYCLATTSKLAELPNRSLTRIGGLIAAVEHRISKSKGKPYSKVMLEDLEGSALVMCWNEIHEKFRPLLELNKAILVIGEIDKGDGNDKQGGELKIIPQEIMPLEDAPRKYTKQVHFRLQMAHLTPTHMEQLKELVAAHPGKCPLLLCFMRPTGGVVFVDTNERYSVMPSLALQQAADALLGKDTYYAKVDTSLPERQRRVWERKPDNGGGGEE